MNCNVINDLLPLYIDECCSDDTKALVESHAESCPRCKSMLAKMQQEIGTQVVTNQTQKKQNPIVLLPGHGLGRFLGSTDSQRSEQRSFCHESGCPRHGVYAQPGKLVLYSAVPQQKAVLHLVLYFAPCSLFGLLCLGLHPLSDGSR